MARSMSAARPWINGDTDCDTKDKADKERHGDGDNLGVCPRLFALSLGDTDSTHGEV